MNYEYNGNLLYSDRIENISNDILKKYTFLSKKQAIMASMMEPPITKDIDDEFRFNRLYNIIYTNMNNKEVQLKIFEDIKEVYLNILGKNNKIDYIMSELINYMYNNGPFPKFIN